MSLLSPTSTFFSHTAIRTFRLILLFDVYIVIFLNSNLFTVNFSVARFLTDSLSLKFAITRLLSIPQSAPLTDGASTILEFPVLS